MAGVSTVQTMFTSGALASASNASLYIAGQSNLYVLTGALELFSGAIDLATPPSFADGFQRHYVSFQEARAAGDQTAALRVARRDLQSLIAGIPDESWPAVLQEIDRTGRRTGILADPAWAIEWADELLGGPLTGWRPEIVVEGENPRQRAVGRAAIRRAMANVFALSVAGDATRKNHHWVERAFSSGLITASKVTARFHSLGKEENDEGDEEVVLKVKYSDMPDGTPAFDIHFNDEMYLTTWPFTHSLLRSADDKKLSWASVRRKHLEGGGRNPSHVTKAHFEGVFDPQRRPPFLGRAMRVQAQLLGGDYMGDLNEALRRFSFGAGTYEKLSRLAANTRLGFSLTALPDGEGSPSVWTKYIPGNRQIFASDGRIIGRLILNLAIPQRFSATISIDDMWLLVVRGLALWALHGEPRDHLNVSLDANPDDLAAPIDQMIFHAKAPSTNLSATIPAEWADEFLNILTFVNILSGSHARYRSDDHPSLNEILDLWEEGDWGSLPLSDLDRISRIVIQHDSSDSKIHIEPPMSDRSGFDILISADAGELIAKFDPMRFAEFVLGASSYSSRKRFSRSGWIPFTMAAEMERPSASFNDSMAWLRLFWQYERLAEAPAGRPGSLNLLGEGARTFSEKLAQAITLLSQTEPNIVNASISDHGTWVIEYGHTERPLENPLKQTVVKIPVQSSNLRVLTASRAKLIHFDGMPEFSDSDWIRIARVILLAPHGTTTVSTVGRWDSNRPEILFTAGDEGWYGLNPAYTAATPAERKGYKRALGFVREMASVHSEKIALPLPEPGWTIEQVRQLRGRMFSIFHPDRTESDIFVDIGQDNVQRLIEAFKVLLRFHDRT